LFWLPINIVINWFKKYNILNIPYLNSNNYSNVNKWNISSQDLKKDIQIQCVFKKGSDSSKMFSFDFDNVFTTNLKFRIRFLEV